MPLDAPVTTAVPRLLRAGALGSIIAPLTIPARWSPPWFSVYCTPECGSATHTLDLALCEEFLAHLRSWCGAAATRQASSEPEDFLKNWCRGPRFGPCWHPLCTHLRRMRVVARSLSPRAPARKEAGMAGVIFLIVFFTLGTALVLLVSWALRAEDARYCSSPTQAPP